MGLDAHSYPNVARGLYKLDQLRFGPSFTICVPAHTTERQAGRFKNHLNVDIGYVEVFAVVCLDGNV